VLFYNSQLEIKALFKTRQRFKIVSFVIHADWLKRTVQPDSVFLEERLFKLPFFRFENVPPAVLQSALNLFTLKTGTSSLDLRIKAIVYDMLSHLFSTFEKREIKNLQAAKYQSDIEAVFKVREQLLSFESTNYPTIDVLAANAAMSRSKLKTLFRAVFGMPVFEFYQQHRLNYALHLIEARELTIGEIGLKIGYNNLSKFSRAFKKQFGFLPRQTLIPDRAIS
jgi:AraC-like DNA-binding protein